MKASSLGTVAAIAGAILYFLIVRATHINFGLVSIVVGFMVGSAVRHGSGNRGGTSYQLLALFLTYCAIALMLLLGVFDVAGLSQVPVSSPPPGFVFVAVFQVVRFFAIPVGAGINDAISGLIYCFALWEAWQLNKTKALVLSGPFRLFVKQPSAMKPEGVDDGV
jgi:hypothetical protein